MRKFFKSFIAVAALGCCTPVFAKLGNYDFYVRDADIASNVVIFWVSKSGASPEGRPAACASHSAVACDPTTDFCKSMQVVALTARLTERTVEFDYSGNCIGSFAEVRRIRMNP